MTLHEKTAWSPLRLAETIREKAHTDGGAYGCILRVPR